MQGWLGVAALLLYLQRSLHLCATAEPGPANLIRSGRNGTDGVDTAATEVEICEWRTSYEIIEILRQQCSKQVPIPRLAGPDTGSPGNEPKAESSGDSVKMEDLGSPVMSFEEWKELMMNRQAQKPGAGQPSQSWEGRPQVAREGEATELEAVRDEVDGSGSEETAGEEWQDDSGGSTEDAVAESVMYDDGKMQYTRSKDAGKTCKERFSYSSFDAGATVLKTSPGAKNPKAILVENKDTYMLLECAAEQKYFIVELSDDILVDTVVLANFEFFSSMIRHFRVSVSDRYPVKLDKWRDLGTFEARNSRDIQPFLVDNPQIWAKYVRIELLSHYGNEYFCPVSLLRVHGTRMLESWKDAEPEQADEDLEEAELTSHGTTLALDGSDGGDGSKLDSGTRMEGMCPVGGDTFPVLDQTCPAATRPSTVQSGSGHDLAEQSATVSSLEGRTGESAVAETTPSTAVNSHSAAPSTSASEPIQDASIPHPTSAVPESQGRNVTVTSKSQARSGAVASTVTTPTKPSESTPSPARNKTNAGVASAPPASPTVQESFFKTVSKRLQLLESNVTWSLKYVEDQSRNLQEALIHIEKKRLSKVEAFLESLNGTLMSEVNSLREQYDQMWQATMTALENQRERSQREMVALSSRLNVLADEVVFQKRMSIGQSVLLLSCLVLIIFSRPVPHVHAQGSGDMLHHGRGRGRISPGALYAVPEEAEDSRVFRHVSPPPSPSPTSTRFDESTKQTSRSRPNPPSTGLSRKPLPALPEYPDDHDQQVTP